MGDEQWAIGNEYWAKKIEAMVLADRYFTKLLILLYIFVW
jgi:hypothetical protein